MVGVVRSGVQRRQTPKEQMSPEIRCRTHWSPTHSLFLSPLCPFCSRSSLTAMNSLPLVEPSDFIQDLFLWRHRHSWWVPFCFSKLLVVHCVRVLSCWSLLCTLVFYFCFFILFCFCCSFLISHPVQMGKMCDSHCFRTALGQQGPSRLGYFRESQRQDRFHVVFEPGSCAFLEKYVNF